MTHSLSAILIARNEETDLPDCLNSLKSLDPEIVIVVSSDTTDRTDEIARQFGAKVIRRPFDDYARQRQAGLDVATKDWCLWIDPDERVTAPLAREISTVLAANPAESAFEIQFEVTFLGRRLRWGGLGSERHVRLFRRTRAQFAGGSLHEHLQIAGPTARLLQKMEHHPYRDLSDYLQKLDRYTTLAAEKRYQSGIRFRSWRHLMLPGEYFIRCVVKLGFLDGFPGLVWAGLAAFHSWLKYAKLREMELREKR